MVPKLDLSKCTAKFTTETHDEYPERLQYLSATLVHPTLGELATASCIQIRGRMRFKNFGDFLELMDEESQELLDFSSGLFDRYSNVRPWLVDGGVKSGSGCWGTELNVGDMLYIVDMNVKKEYMRRGVGSCFLQKILTSPYLGHGDHAFCWPTPISSAAGGDKAEWMKQQAAITAFYRKNGFRRIGLTSFLAYSPEPSHPSRKLPIALDPETPTIDFESANPTAQNLTAAQLSAQYPLHYAIGTNKTPAIAQLIRTMYQVRERVVHERDANGFMPVHIAAGSENAHALRALLELDPTGIVEDLKDRKNKDGVTPLEGLESSMRSTKEFLETLMGAWKGYSDEGLRCEYILKKAMGLMDKSEGEEEYITKRKFGCTCGKCTDGWLSPRMRFRLLAQAEIQGDMHRMDIDAFKPRQPLSASELSYSTFDYLPPTIRREIYKTFYIGFYTIFDAIAEILKTPGIPTPQAVVAVALVLNTSAVQFYLKKGGRVEYVLDATVNIAKEQSSLGDGTFEETFDVDDEEDVGNLGYRKLEKCANDLEFAGVRLGVGISDGFDGPYLDEEEDEEGMDVDGYGLHW